VPIHGDAEIARIAAVTGHRARRMLSAMLGRLDVAAGAPGGLERPLRRAA
jgi:hypothetical protein